MIIYKQHIVKVNKPKTVSHRIIKSGFRRQREKRKEKTKSKSGIYD